MLFFFFFLHCWLLVGLLSVPYLQVGFFLHRWLLVGDWRLPYLQLPPAARRLNNNNFLLVLFFFFLALFFFFFLHCWLLVGLLSGPYLQVGFFMHRLCLVGYLSLPNLQLPPAARRRRVGSSRSSFRSSAVGTHAMLFLSFVGMCKRSCVFCLQSTYFSTEIDVYMVNLISVTMGAWSDGLRVPGTLAARKYIFSRETEVPPRR